MMYIFHLHYILTSIGLKVLFKITLIIILNSWSYMFKKDINFKSIFFKVFFTYLVVYFLALIFRYYYDIEPLLINIQYKYLIFLNIISIFLGLPLSIIFDFILIIRSFPILPHILGSYIIASTNIKKKIIFLYTFLGSFFYYIFLFLIIVNV